MALFKKNPNKIIEPVSDRVLQGFCTVIILLLLVVVGYPVVYVISSSFSSAAAIQSGRVVFLPIDPTLAGYKFVFQYDTVWLGYRNSLFYTVFGTIINMFLSILFAYPLSKSDLPLRGFYNKLIVVTMLFGAGMIPTFILKSKLGLVDTIWAILLSGAVSIHNTMIIRTSFKSSIPKELYEAAKIDGANDFKCLTSIAIPLSKATLSVITLYYAVGHWNQYFTAMIYLRNKNLFPLQIFLRTILTAGQSIDASSVSETMLQQVQDGTQQIKYALIVVSTVPVILLYFIVQKYFKKGVMVGSIKG
ncbi:MAG: carbohydrate ABC transporter permease [Clostridia bacterium]|nr:carbohydrate ABC transporter permease [Clostridia bacterium]